MLIDNLVLRKVFMTKSEKESEKIKIEEFLKRKLPEAINERETELLHDLIISATCIIITCYEQANIARS